MEDEGINSGFFPLIAADLLLLVKNRRVEIAFQQYYNLQAGPQTQHLKDII